MKTTLPAEALAHYIARQLEQFFPDGENGSEREITRHLSGALDRLAEIAASVHPPLFRRAGEIAFDHLHSDQYAAFLYLLAHSIGTSGGPTGLATKLYLLNKALHGLDVFYEVKLPRLFLFMHPVGTVLGRAEYSDCFIAMQQCTVGNIRGEYPKLGRGTVLCAGSAILGAAELGDGVTLGAGSLVVGSAIQSNTTVVGRARDLRALPTTTPMWKDYFIS